MLARDTVLALDAAEYMRAAGFPPDDWQRDFLRSTATRSLLLTSRQCGKSTVTAALASHVATFTPNALVLLLAPSQQQSRELFRKVCQFHRGATDADPDAASAQRIELQNGSRIVSLSGNPLTVRGFSGPRLVVLDEAAFTEDDLYHAVSPMLSSGGRLVALTTPNGRQGWFSQAWHSGGPMWSRTRVTAHDSPRLTPDFLAAERAAMPEWRFRQEFQCEFVENDETLFSADLIARAMSPAVQPIIPDFAW